MANEGPVRDGETRIKPYHYWRRQARRHHNRLEAADPGNQYRVARLEVSRFRWCVVRLPREEPVMEPIQKPHIRHQ